MYFSRNQRCLFHHVYWYLIHIYIIDPCVDYKFIFLYFLVMHFQNVWLCYPYFTHKCRNERLKFQDIFHMATYNVTTLCRLINLYIFFTWWICKPESHTQIQYHQRIPEFSETNIAQCTWMNRKSNVLKNYNSSKYHMIFF